MTKPPIEFLLHLRGLNDDPNTTEGASDDANPVQDFFEAQKLTVALGGTKPLTKEASRVHPALPPDLEEQVDATRVLQKSAENLVRRNSDGSYLMRSPNGKWLMKYDANHQLLSGYEVPTS